MRMLSLTAATLTLLIGFFASPTSAQSPEEVERVEKAQPDAPTAKPKSRRNLLIFTRAAGFRHSSIPIAAKALSLLGEKTGAWQSVISDDPAVFAKASLDRFDGISFVNTTGTLFTEQAYKDNLLEFARSGKGISGFHAASDSFYDWPEFGQLIGGYFAGHLAVPLSSITSASAYRIVRIEQRVDAPGYATGECRALCTSHEKSGLEIDRERSLSV
jgi:hypothetical protein